MLTAALYDIHGNIAALNAVLDEAVELAVDRIIIGGDILPGPNVRATVDRLRALQIPAICIRGNCENDLLVVCDGREPVRVPEQYRGAIADAAAQLSTREIDWIRSWHYTVALSVARMGTVLFCHATPHDDNGIVRHDAADEEFESAFGDAEQPIIVCGHTHVQYDRRMGDKRVINAGSVGMPFDGTSARWVLLGPDDVQLRATSF